MPAKELTLMWEVLGGIKGCGASDERIDGAFYTLSALKGDGDVNSLIAQCREQIKNEKANWPLLTSLGRLEIAAGNWDKAAAAWAKCAAVAKGGSERWWMAKYYEYFSLCRENSGDKQSLLHSIEVTQSSYKDVPVLWQVKFESLKKEL